MRLILLLAFTVTCCSGVDVHATTQGINPQPTIADQTVEMPLALRGQGRLTYYLWNVYDVDLYLPASVPSAAVLDDYSRRLQFTYLRAFTAEDLAKATTTTIRERQGDTPDPEIVTGLAAINAMWPSVVVGDRLELWYRSGQGTTVSLNGKRLGEVPGVQFARVLFSIWLGEGSINNGLRKKLLGIS